MEVLCEAREEVSLFFADSACDDEPSPCPPTGACCFVDESCTLLDEATCTDKTYNDNECSDTGASCDNNDDCADGVCITAYWLSTDVCDPPSDICERGSCCSHADGECEEDVIESVCLDQSQYHEFHQSLNCASVWCPVVGACCRGDGTCDDDEWDVDCSAPLDTFFPTTACADLAPPPCEPGERCCEAKGACCRHSTGVCDDRVLESDCAGDYEDFHADRTCDSVGECTLYGACCRRLPESCTLEPNAADCAAVDNGVFVGTGELCTPNPCYRVGACCSLADGECTDDVLDLDCPLTPSEDDCAAATYAHYGGLLCEQGIPCPPHGPCCLPGDYWGQNIAYMAKVACVDSGGFYGGDGAVCDADLCTPGACCLPDVGIETCQQRTVQGCEFGSGGFLGEGTECTYRCSDSGGFCNIANGSDDCDKACSVFGAACESDAGCTRAVCAGTSWVCEVTQDCEERDLGVCSDGAPCNFSAPNCGDGSECHVVECLTETCEPVEDCVAVDCARGACCRPDGTCDDNVVEVQCAGPLDRFHVGETCIDIADECTALGACCSVEVCTEKEPGECTGGGGFYAGNGTLCGPDLCVVGACCQPSEACVEGRSDLL